LGKRIPRRGDGGDGNDGLLRPYSKRVGAAEQHVRQASRRLPQVDGFPSSSPRGHLLDQPQPTPCPSPRTAMAGLQVRESRVWGNAFRRGTAEREKCVPEPDSGDPVVVARGLAIAVFRTWQRRDHCSKSNGTHDSRTLTVPAHRLCIGEAFSTRPYFIVTTVGIVGTPLRIALVDGPPRFSDGLDDGDGLLRRYSRRPVPTFVASSPFLNPTNPTPGTGMGMKAGVQDRCFRRIPRKPDARIRRVEPPRVGLRVHRRFRTRTRREKTAYLCKPLRSSSGSSGSLKG
jgi:hypothetical protein